MNRILTRFLQAIVMFIGIVTVVFLLWEPHVEGRNVGATTVQIYFNDPFLAYAYLSSIPFFVVLVQSFRLLGLVGDNKGRSPESAKALRTIRRCAISFACLVGAAVAYLSVFERGKDDIAGGVAMGLAMTVSFVIIAVVASAFERRL